MAGSRLHAECRGGRGDSTVAADCLVRTQVQVELWAGWWLVDGWKMRRGTRGEALNHPTSKAMA